MPRNGQKNKVVGLCSIDEPANFAKKRRSLRLCINQSDYIPNPHCLQRLLYVARVGHSSLQWTNMLVGVDPNHQGANRTACRITNLKLLLEGICARRSQAGEPRQNNTDTYSRKPMHCTSP